MWQTWKYCWLGLFLGELALAFCAGAATENEPVSVEVFVLAKRYMERTDSCSDVTPKWINMESILFWIREHPGSQWREMLAEHDCLRNNEKAFLGAVEEVMKHLGKCQLRSISEALLVHKPDTSQLRTLKEIKIFEGCEFEACTLLNLTVPEKDVELGAILPEVSWISLMRTAYLLDQCKPDSRYSQLLFSILIADEKLRTVLTLRLMSKICAVSTPLTFFLSEQTHEYNDDDCLATCFRCDKSNALAKFLGAFLKIGGMTVSQFIIEMQKFLKDTYICNDWYFLHAVCDVYRLFLSDEDKLFCHDAVFNAYAADSRLKMGVDLNIEVDEFDALLEKSNLVGILPHLIFILCDFSNEKCVGLSCINKDYIRSTLRKKTRREVLRAFEYLGEEFKVAVMDCFDDYSQKRINELKKQKILQKNIELSELLFYISDSQVCQEYQYSLLDSFDCKSEKDLSSSVCGWWSREKGRKWFDFFNLVLSQGQSDGLYEILSDMVAWLESSDSKRKEFGVVSLSPNVISSLEKEINQKLVCGAVVKILCDEMKSPHIDLERFLKAFKLINNAAFNLFVNLLPPDVKKRFSSLLWRVTGPSDVRSIENRMVCYCPVVNSLPKVYLDQAACFMIAKNLKILTEANLQSQIESIFGFSFDTAIALAIGSSSEEEKLVSMIQQWAQSGIRKKTWPDLYDRLQDEIKDCHLHKWHKAIFQLYELFQRHQEPSPFPEEFYSDNVMMSSSVSGANQHELNAIRCLLRFERGELVWHEQESVRPVDIIADASKPAIWNSAQWRYHGNHFHNQNVMGCVLYQGDTEEKMVLPLKRISRRELLMLVFRLEGLDKCLEVAGRALGLTSLFDKKLKAMKTNLGKRYCFLDAWLKASIDPSWYWLDRRLRGGLGTPHKNKLDQLRLQLLEAARCINFRDHQYAAPALRSRLSCSNDGYGQILGVILSSSVNAEIEDVKEVIPHFSWSELIACPLFSQEQKAAIEAIRQEESRQ